MKAIHKDYDPETGLHHVVFMAPHDGMVLLDTGNSFIGNLEYEKFLGRLIQGTRPELADMELFHIHMTSDQWMVARLSCE